MPARAVPSDSGASPTWAFSRSWRSSVRPVKIAVSSFFYADSLGFRRQHELAAGEFLQGALLSRRLFERVYVVVVPVPGADTGWIR